MLSYVQLFATPWTVAHQAPLSMGFSNKNTRVDSHVLLQEIFLTQRSNLVSCIAGRFFTIWATRESHIFIAKKVEVTQSCLILCHRGLYSLWNSPGQNAGVGSLSLLQGIFPTQGSNPALQHCRWFLTN